MRGIDVDPHSELLGVAMKPCPHRAQRLGQHQGGAAMEQSIGLRVSLDWHCRHDALCRYLDELDTHLFVQGA